MRIEPLVHAVNHLHGHGWVDEVGSANLDSRGTGHHKFYGIGGVHDAAQSDHGNFHGLGHLPHHAQRNGLHTRAAQASRADAEARAPALHIDTHAHEGIDERNTIGSLGFHGTSYFGNIRYVGRKLYYQGFIVYASYCPHHTCRSFTGDAKGHASALHIGAGYVQLDARNGGQRSDAGSTGCIVLGRMSGHVDQHIGLQILQLRINLFTEIIGSLVLQSHTVEHARRGFRHARIIVAFARCQSGSLDNKPAQAVQVNKIGELQAVAKGAGSRHHGIFQIQSAYLYI